ncbi:MAG: MmgE/PrpD family protein [Thermogemmata sp.]|nr:MmgE/PrpD family protein [Thermogemmata sp.]
MAEVTGSAPTLAQRLARYASQLRYEQLPPDVVHEAKRRLIDSLATAVGALSAPAYAKARRCAERVTSQTPASLIGGGSSSVEWATFVNGLLIRYLDYNDTYLSLEPAHPSDNWSAVLAVGEACGASGQEVITAVVLAYEVQCRLCDAASLRRQGIDHVTYGAISSTLAAGRLLRLDVERLTHAVGIAAVSNIALRQTRSGELSEWKGCAFANAARNGVFAALLAAEGLTGPAPIFEGDLGFFRLVTRQSFNPAPFGAEPENQDGFMITKTYIKYWPAEYHSQSAIDAALQLRQQLRGQIQRIQTIRIDTFEACYNIIGKYPQAWAPQTRETADHSLPYCTAAALFDGDITLATFDERRFTDPELIRFTQKVQVVHDPGLDARYPRGIPNRLTLTLDDGTQLVREVEFPRGHAFNPMSDAEVEAKFRRLVTPHYGEERTEAILSCCWSLDQLDHVHQLMRLLDLPTPRVCM